MTPSRYSSGLASKYLNRSRHTFDDDTPSTPSPRYGSSTTSSASYSRPSYLSKRKYLTNLVIVRVEAPNPSTSRDKKAKMSKSKSTHDVLSGYRSASLDFDPEEREPAESRAGRRRKLSAAPPVTDDTASLSSWARYLKNKYGKAEKKGDRGVSFDEGSASSATSPTDRPKRLSFSTPAHPYIGKSRIQYKFGSRGSEPGKLTWPRGICCAEGPDGSIQLVVADST